MEKSSKPGDVVALKFATESESDFGTLWKPRSNSKPEAQKPIVLRFRNISIMLNLRMKVENDYFLRNLVFLYYLQGKPDKNRG